MKPAILILSFLVSLAPKAKAQSLLVDSTRFITGYECCTQIYSAIPTADKGILFVGLDGGNPGGIIPYFPDDTSNHGNVFIGKIDSNRHISWLKVYGGSQRDQAASACQTTDGGYAILGTTWSNDGNVTGLTTGGEDMWLLRLDGAGNLLWQKCFGCDTGGAGGISIANTLDNGFILMGTSNGFGADVPFHYGSEFSLDWVVIKTDSMGNKLWCKDLGGTGDEGTNEGTLSGVILTAPKNISGYYLVSSSSSTDHDCTDTIWHTGVNTGGDYYLIKLDTSGNVQWDSSYGGTGDDNISSAFFDMRDSSIVITGFTNSNDYIETGLQHGEGDMLTIKVDKNGKLIWHQSIGGASWDIGTNVIRGPGNGYILYGSTYPYPDTTMGDIGEEDCWIFVLDNTGNVIVNKIFGGLYDELPFSIVPFYNGYIAMGVSQSSVFTEGFTNGRNSNGQDAFISYIDYWKLGIHQLNNSVGIVLSLFPNPAENSVSVLLQSNHSGGAITIQNSVGQIMYSVKIDNQAKCINIDTKNWAKGLYIVQWQDENKNTLTEKLIIN